MLGVIRFVWFGICGLALGAGAGGLYTVQNLGVSKRNLQPKACALNQTLSALKPNENPTCSRKDLPFWGILLWFLYI